MSELLTKDQVTGLGIEDLLDLDVDQLAAVQPFIPKPTGIYAFECTGCSVEEIGDTNVIKAAFKLLECVELDNEDELEDVGELPAEYSETYFVESDKTDYGIRAFKTTFNGLVAEGESCSIRELMERSVGSTGQALIKRTSRKNKETGELKVFNNIEPTAINFD